MPATTKKRKREEEDNKSKNDSKAKTKMPWTVDKKERDRLKAKYLAPSKEESELSEDAWEDGDIEWEIEKIVDESVDMAGNHRYQVAWKNWKRNSDGTNTTWVQPEQLDNADEVMAEWQVEKKQRIIKRRKKYAETGYPVSLFAHGCFTRFNTTLEELGLGDDQELTPDMVFPSYVDDSWSDWDKEVEETKKTALAHMAKLDSSSRGDAISSTAGASNEDDVEMEIAPHILRSSSGAARYRTPKSTSDRSSEIPDFDLYGHGQSPNSVHSSVNRPAKRMEKGKERRAETDRTKLQDLFDRATERDGAASVVLVNEVDDELIPPSVDLATFEYIERGPYRHDGNLTSHANFLAGCNCEDGCRDPWQCHCQDEGHAEQIMADGMRVFAYDKNGKYRFPQVSVTECNDNCQCDLTCRNRVAQRPRDVPLELFKTSSRGWGVRATIFIPKGKVLGVFMGDLKRSSFDENEDFLGSQEEEANNYSFELDWFHQAHRWKVVSKDCGNWSRFLKWDPVPPKIEATTDPPGSHSCYPNVKVYGLLYDSVMDAGEDNRHRLGFVATRDIEAYTELLINYSPGKKPNVGGKCCEYGKCIRIK